MAGFIRILETGAIRITEADAARVSEDFVPDATVAVPPPSQHTLFFIPRVAPRRQAVRGRLQTRQAPAWVEAEGAVTERVPGLVVTQPRRSTVTARARQCFQGRTGTWQRRGTLTVTAQQDLAAWTARRVREDDELLLLLQILDEHEPSLL